jgi:DNA modification methylase
MALPRGVVVSACRWMQGDVFTRMRELPDSSVDLIVTSPPFLALRSYLPADHPDKHKEIGSEPTPAAFLSTLLALTREWRRILAPHGSIAVELGDTYSGSGGAGGDYTNDGGFHEGQPTFRQARDRNGWPLAKSLCLIPSLYAGSLAYGHNLLNPADRIKPWRIRNLIVWHRPNPPVGALGDKVRPSTSYITTACVSDKRWFDLDAERTAPVSGEAGAVVGFNGSGFRGITEGGDRHTVTVSHPAGAPPLDAWFDTTTEDVWTIPTHPYKGAHYATYPIALPRRLINLMAPREVCVVCGEPRRRIVGEAEYVNNSGRPASRDMDRNHFHKADELVRHFDTQGDNTAHRIAPTIGWTDCDCLNACQRCYGHGTVEGPEPGWYERKCPDCHGQGTATTDKYRRGVVLDPFAGSGTTLAAAAETGRDAIGIDLDPRNLQLARDRLGLFLEETA